MKLSSLLTLPIASLAITMSSQAHAAVADLAADPSQQMISPSPLALLGLGSLVGICFFVQRTR